MIENEFKIGDIVVFEGHKTIIGRIKKSSECLPDARNFDKGCYYLSDRADSCHHSKLRKAQWAEEVLFKAIGHEIIYIR